MPAGHEGRQEGYTGGGTSRLDMRKYVGGHELCSGAWQVPLDVQVADLQQRINEKDDGMVPHVIDRLRGTVLADVFLCGIDSHRVRRDHFGYQTAVDRRADRNCNIEARLLQVHLPGRRQKLNGQMWMLHA